MAGGTEAMIETKLDRRALLVRIDQLLEARYRSGDLGNVDDPLAETVYILLSKQTQEPVYQRIYRELRHRYPRWIDVLQAPDEDIVALLRPAGLARDAATRIRPRGPPATGDANRTAPRPAGATHAIEVRTPVGRHRPTLA